MGEEEIKYLSCDLCDLCDQIYSTICYDDDGGREWACVGLITEPTNKKNIHDNLNTIRLCIEKENDQSKITTHEWTVYEAHTIALLLNMAVNVEVKEGQPTIEKVNQLLEIGFTDHLKESQEGV